MKTWAARFLGIAGHAMVRVMRRHISGHFMAWGHVPGVHSEHRREG